MDPELYRALDARLAGLERETAALRFELNRVVYDVPQQPAAAPPASPPVPPPPIAPMPAAMSSAAHAAASRGSLEAFFAGRGLQLAGLFLLLLGTAFFLNLAFSRGWVGPAERIILGLVAGAALLFEGARRHRPGDMPIAEGLIALGSGILYLSLWAAVAVFPDLHVSRTAAFIAMVAVTAVLGAVSTVRRSQRIALLGLIGGFLTPLLLSSGAPDRPLLAGYLFVLGIGFAILGVRARYRFVEAAAFAATMIYLPMFVSTDAVWPVPAAVAVIVVLCASFAALFTIGAIRDAAGTSMRNALLSVDAFMLVTMLAAILRDRQTALGIAYLVAAAALILAARFIRVPRTMTLAYGYLGLAIATCALPALLHRLSLLDALAAEGAILVALGARRADNALGVAGAVVLGCVCVWLMGEAFAAPPAGTPFSTLALSFAITIAAIAYACSHRGGFPVAHQTAQGLGTTGAIVGNAIAVLGISRVLLDALGGPAWNQSVPSHAQFALSFAWTAYAAVLFGMGMRSPGGTLRRQGLVLFALTIFKVFTVDLSNVDVSWRIASFVVLGVVCLALSAWYMRTQAATRQAEA